jgi:uncharacterized delta-60 repeat protein
MQKKKRLFAFAVVFAAFGCERTVPTATPDVGPPSFAATAPPTLLSETTWGGADNDVTEGAAVASDGSSYLVGFTRSFGGDLAPKLFTVKFAADGSLEWQRTWDAPGQFVGDEGRDAAVGPDGSVYVTGFTFVDGNASLVLKFGSDGTLLWQRTFGGNGRGEGIAVGSDGSVYVTGATRGFGAGEEDLFVVKLSPEGTLVWFKTWGMAAANEQGQGIAVGPDGNVYVAGVGPRPDDPFQFQFDAVVLKVDPAGNLIWQRAFPGGDQTDARGGIDVAPDGSVYVGGGFQGPVGGGFANDGLMLKLTSDGSLVWARRWDGGFAEDMAVAPDGRIVFVGGTSLGQGDGDAFVLRLEPNGKTSDASIWGGLGLDAGRGVGVAPDGTISLGAVAEQPPYTLAGAAGHTARARVSVSTPTVALVDAPGTVADPNGVVEIPNGTTTYGGQFEAALVRIAP